MDKYKQEDWLREQYVENDVKVVDIADKCDVHLTTIYNWIDRFDLEYRETPCEGKYTDKEWLRKKYVKEKVPVSEIADECDVHGSTISDWIDKFNIEKRSLSESVKLSWKNADERRERFAELMSERDIDKSGNWTEGKSEEEYREICDKVQDSILKVSDQWSGDDNPSKRSEVREKISKSHEKNPRYSNVEVVEELGHIVRSGWEKEVAYLLQDNNIDYEYEGQAFKLKNGMRYIPDFILDDYIIEVKGYPYQSPEEKIELFIEQTDRTYIVVGTEMPCDIHIGYDNRERLLDVV